MTIYVFNIVYLYEYQDLICQILRNEDIVRIFSRFVEVLQKKFPEISGFLETVHADDVPGSFSLSKS